MVRFIDRVNEINALREYCRYFRYVTLYVYGPEGCGKTRLLKEFVKRFDDFFGVDSIAIYIDAIEGRDVERALLTSTTISRIADMFKLSLDAASDLIQIGTPIGQAIAKSISFIIDRIIEKLPGRNLKDRYLLIAVDDVTRAIGLDKIEWYIKWLFELMNKLNEKYKPEAINFIATTSEGISRGLIARHRHADISLLWNLDRESFEELFYELNPPSSIVFNDVWMLFNGNPGKLIELAERFRWNIDAMLTRYELRVKKIVEEIAKKGLINELKLLAENITLAENILNEKIGIVEKILEEENLILYKDWITLTDEKIKSQPDIGIGEKYAWQTPMYRELTVKALRSLLKK